MRRNCPHCGGLLVGRRVEHRDKHSLQDIGGWWMNRKGEGERIVRKVDRRRGSEEGKM
jgi:hypothetical protein